MQENFKIIDSIMFAKYRFTLKNFYSYIISLKIFLSDLDRFLFIKLVMKIEEKIITLEETYNLKLQKLKIYIENASVMN